MTDINTVQQLVDALRDVIQSNERWGLTLRRVEAVAAAQAATDSGTALIEQMKRDDDKAQDLRDTIRAVFDAVGYPTEYALQHRKEKVSVTFKRWFDEQMRQREAAPQEPFCYVQVNKQGDITRTVKRKDSWARTPLYATPQPHPDARDAARYRRLLSERYQDGLPEEGAAEVAFMVTYGWRTDYEISAAIDADIAEARDRLAAAPQPHPEAVNAANAAPAVTLTNDDYWIARAAIDALVYHGRSGDIDEKYAMDGAARLRTLLDAAHAASVSATATPPAESADARDAARYRLIRRKICFTGNGDGTASMHAINLPNSARFPGIGEIEEAVDAAIDAAMSPAGKEQSNG
jgi:hypothetical protein